MTIYSPCDISLILEYLCVLIYYRSSQFNILDFCFRVIYVIYDIIIYMRLEILRSLIYLSLRDQSCCIGVVNQFRVLNLI